MSIFNLMMCRTLQVTLVTQHHLSQGRNLPSSESKHLLNSVTGPVSAFRAGCGELRKGVDLVNGSGRDITAVQVATFEECQAKGDETQAQGANAVTMMTDAHGTMTCYIKQVGSDSTERSLPEATSMKLCTSAAGHTGPDVIITLPGTGGLPCNADENCGFGEVCIGDLGNRKCQVPSDVGGSCEGHKACKEGLYCSAECGPTEFCNARDPTNDLFTCKPKKPNGPTSFCASDDVCLSGHCSASRDCEAEPMRGLPCTVDEHCGSGELCIGVLGNRKCQVPSDVGGSCGGQKDCKEGLYCPPGVARKCAAKRPMGARCNGNENNACLSGACKFEFPNGHRCA